jgi:molecular chaperone IbpA
MDLAPLTRSSIGFDRLFDLMAHAAQFDQNETYPPYNIERTGEDAYRISLAVAGFAEEDLAITWQPNQLLVAGRRAPGSAGEMLYQGIQARPFQRQFSLADDVRVAGATLHNGMLAIELTREVPEASKPRRIAIGGRTAESAEVRAAA